MVALFTFYPIYFATWKLDAVCILSADIIYFLNLQYDLSKFCPYNTVLVDHSDPSINTGGLSLNISNVLSSIYCH